ncbi:MAG: hypothetical protein HY961_09630 [Ignavibacteriae bacterium]|nr:hypothetical protein [Ignavibacteriota bacterium]
MKEIRKKIVADESNMRPIAVQIDYEDWQEIERQLGAVTRGKDIDLSKYAGKIHLTEDPLVYQKRIRSEWQ